MIQYMGTEFMTHCEETMVDQPEMRSVMEHLSVTPVALCVCASEFAMNNWTPAELMEEANERPNNFAYELGGGVLACLTERAG